MPIRPCPTCENPTPRDLETEWAHVATYRCEVCGHVWQRDVLKPDADPITLAEGQRPSPPTPEV